MALYLPPNDPEKEYLNDAVGPNVDGHAFQIML